MKGSTRSSWTLKPATARGGVTQRPSSALDLLPIEADCLTKFKARTLFMILVIVGSLLFGLLLLYWSFVLQGSIGYRGDNHPLGSVEAHHLIAGASSDADPEIILRHLSINLNTSSRGSSTAGSNADESPSSANTTVSSAAANLPAVAANIPTSSVSNIRTRQSQAEQSHSTPSLLPIGTSTFNSSSGASTDDTSIILALPGDNNNMTVSVFNKGSPPYRSPSASPTTDATNAKPFSVTSTPPSSPALRSKPSNNKPKLSLLPMIGSNTSSSTTTSSKPTSSSKLQPLSEGQQQAADIAVEVETSSSESARSSSSAWEFECTQSNVSGEQLQSQPITRALVAFFPVDQMISYEPELRWFIRSWIEIMKYEPELWRTDLILYVENTTEPTLLELGCSTRRRTSPLEAPRCILWKHTKLEHRDSRVEAGKKPSLAHLLVGYKFADSILSLAENPDAFQDYDWVLRTDLDTFLTKAFATYTPASCSLLCGGGGYSSDWNMKKLSAFARAKGISNYNESLSNIGSTWYGPGKVVAKLAERAVYWMRELAEEEFTPKMRNPDFWTKAYLWPDWHFGVLSMYGAHIAFNELLQGNSQVSFQKSKSMLDFPTSSEEDAHSGAHVHLHAWHSSLKFSIKERFKKNQYTEFDFNATANSTSCRDYAAFIAFESKRLESSELGSWLGTVKQ